MEKIKSDQEKVLKEILGKKWKKIPQVNEIEWDKFGVKIKDGNVIGLGLHNRKLTTLPESMGNLSSLQTLELNYNQLTTLPESIGKLKSLEELNLRGNKLTALPESIGNLKSLQALDLSGNKLTTLPDSISNLKSLIRLDLSHNYQLTTLPESMGNLSSLQTLELNYNQLTTLPESIGNLKSLEELNLRGNKLPTLPGSIGNLKSLKRLDLEGNTLNQEFKKIIKMANGDIQFILRKLRERLEKESLEKERLEEERLEVEKKNMEKRYKRERPIIEKLIQEMKFSDAVLKLKDIKNIAKRYNLSEIISWADEKLDSCNNLEKTESLKKNFPMIEKLIREMKFSNAIGDLNNIRKIAKKNSLDEIINWTEKNLKLCNEHIIKKTVLELGIKFARLQIAEISEVCGADDVQLIVDVVKDMIDNKEIYAQYFSSTKSVAFDQQANIDEIDRLMATYKEWEEKEVGKK